MTPPSRSIGGGCSTIARASSACTSRMLAERARRARCSAAQSMPASRRCSSGRRASAVAQLCEIARPRRAQRDAREDALEIAECAQQARAARRAARLSISASTACCRSSTGRRRAAAGAASGAARGRPSRSRCGRARRRACTPGAPLGCVVELEVAARRRVEQRRLSPRVFSAQAVAGAAARPSACRARMQQGSRRRAIASARSAQPKPARSRVPKLLAQRARARSQVEMPRRPLAAVNVVDAVGSCDGFAARAARPAQAARSRRQRFVAVGFEHAEAAARQVEPGEAEALRRRGTTQRRATCRGARSSSASSVTVPGVTTRTTLRSTGPLAVAGSPICSQIATDSPRRTSLREIAFDRVQRHAGHRNRLAGRLAARGQRDVEQPRGAPRIVEEQLVEVAHAIEQQRVRVLRLEAQVLLHDGRVGFERG